MPARYIIVFITFSKLNFEGTNSDSMKKTIQITHYFKKNNVQLGRMVGIYDCP